MDIAALVACEWNPFTIIFVSIVVTVLFWSLVLFLRHLKYPVIIQGPAVPDIEGLGRKLMVLDMNRK